MRGYPRGEVERDTSLSCSESLVALSKGRWRQSERHRASAPPEFEFKSNFEIAMRGFEVVEFDAQRKSAKPRDHFS